MTTQTLKWYATSSLWTQPISQLLRKARATVVCVCVCVCGRAQRTQKAHELCGSSWVGLAGDDIYVCITTMGS